MDIWRSGRRQKWWGSFPIRCHHGPCQSYVDPPHTKVEEAGWGAPALKNRKSAVIAMILDRVLHGHHGTFSRSVEACGLLRAPHFGPNIPNGPASQGLPSPVPYCFGVFPFPFNNTVIVSSGIRKKTRTHHDALDNEKRIGQNTYLLSIILGL